MASRFAVPDAAPVLDLNTTPLIDVLLVLLVMFIITVPVQTHAVKLDLPAVPPVPQPNPVKNLLEIDRAGRLAWNGTPMTKAMLRQEVRLTQQMQPVPELHLRPDAYAPYAKVDEVLGLLKREHVTKMGFVGNEAYAIR